MSTTYWMGARAMAFSLSQPVLMPSFAALNAATVFTCSDVAQPGIVFVKNVPMGENTQRLIHSQELENPALISPQCLMIATAARPIGPPSAPTSHGQFVLTHVNTVWNAAGSVFVKKPTNGPLTQSTTASAPPFSSLQTYCTALRNQSNRLYIRTTATTTAVIARTIQPHGPALATMLNAVMATVATRWATAHAIVATVHKRVTRR